MHKCVRNTKVYSLFLHTHIPVRRQSDMTGVSSGAGPTALLDFRGPVSVHRQLTRLRIATEFLRWEN